MVPAITAFAGNRVLVRADRSACVCRRRKRKGAQESRRGSRGQRTDGVDVGCHLLDLGLHCACCCCWELGVVLLCELSLWVLLLQTVIQRLTYSNRLWSRSTRPGWLGQPFLELDRDSLGWAVLVLGAVLELMQVQEGRARGRLRWRRRVARGSCTDEKVQRLYRTAPKLETARSILSHGSDEKARSNGPRGQHDGDVSRARRRSRTRCISYIVCGIAMRRSATNDCLTSLVPGWVQSVLFLRQGDSSRQT